MIRSSARPKYDTAILGAEYDTDTARVLAQRLSSGLAEPTTIWTRDAANPGAVDADEVCSRSRTVIVLHDRLWGRTAPTLEDKKAVEARVAREGGSSVFFVSLDDTALPTWAKKAKVADFGSKSLDECVSALVASIGDRGGRLRSESGDDLTERASLEERRVRDRDAYLASHRSGPACARELERLTDDVIQRVEALDRADEAPEIDVKRAAGRCIIQLGPVALTMSWIRSRTDAVIEGRLMIMEWDGIVRRGTDHVPERAPLRQAVRPATLLREDVFVADTANEQDWRWRRDGRALGTYTSRDLATRCLASLTARLEEVALAASA